MRACCIALSKLSEQTTSIRDDSYLSYGGGDLWWGCNLVFTINLGDSLVVSAYVPLGGSVACGKCV